MSASVNQLALVVTSGELSGATMLLDKEREYSIGATLEHDVVLRGVVQDGSSVRLVVDNDGVSVVDSANSLTRRAQYSDEIVLGTARFIIEAPPVETNSVSGSFIKNDTNRASVTLLRVGGFAVIGFVALAFIFTQWFNQAAPTISTVSLESRLHAANLSQVEIERTPDSKFVLSGYVKSREHAIRLAQFINLQPENLVNHVLVDEEIKDQIIDVLRVNEILGSVDSLGDGAFVANTQLSTEDELRQLQALIDRDVPSVKSFSVKNEQPATPAPVMVAEVSLPPLKEGKRVVMVNSDNPAYVVTEDQSRYFIGSVLPGGYRISAISNGRVMIERRGVETELKF